MNDGTLYDVSKELVINYYARVWCLLPYPDHPNGCPNFGTRYSCPPGAPRIEDFADMSRPLYFVIVTFDLAKHMRRMLFAHPGWSDRQASCCRYWQNGVRKELARQVHMFRSNGQGSIFTDCPEAMGVNVIETLKRLEVPVEVRPKNLVHKVALLCYPKTEAAGSGSVTRVVNAHVTHYNVMVDRTTIFGNPFRVKPYGPYSREECLKKFEEYFYRRIENDPEWKAEVLKLKGKVLGCHCVPMQCHGEIYADYLNAYDWVEEIKAVRRGS